MADPTRVGIVGATVTPGGSGWGANAHIPALQALPGYRLHAVCTAHQETAAASAARFGAELAFHDIDEMLARPEIDLVVVSVRVPWHYDLVMAGLRAGKPVFCEWPLGATLDQAQEMADFAHERDLPTAVGLQARSDPSVRYARDLVAQGYVGKVLAANLRVISQAVLERGPGRIWQSVRANGANPLTIAGGHSIDALCCILGEVLQVSARVTTRITQWRHADTGLAVPVDAPDSISVAARIESGAEIAIQVASVPAQATGTRLEIYGDEGALFLTARSANIGPAACRAPAAATHRRSWSRRTSTGWPPRTASRARRATSHTPTRGWRTPSQPASNSIPASTWQCGGIACWPRSSVPRRRAAARPSPASVRSYPDCLLSSPSRRPPRGGSAPCGDHRRAP